MVMKSNRELRGRKGKMYDVVGQISLVMNRVNLEEMCNVEYNLMTHLTSFTYLHPFFRSGTVESREI